MGNPYHAGKLIPCRPQTYKTPKALMNMQHKFDSAEIGKTTQTPLRMLVFRRGSIGDAIVSIPALNHLRQKYEGWEFVCLSNAPVMETASPVRAVLERSGLIDDFIDLPPGGGSIGALIKNIQLIREQKFASVQYLSEPSSRAALLKEVLFFKLCGITAIHGLPVSDVIRRYQPANVELWESESDRLLRTVAAPEPTQADWSFQFLAQEIETAQNLLAGLASSEEHIAFSIGAKLPDKDWGDTNWTQVLSALSERYPNLGLLSVGSAEDRLRTEHISAAWTGPHVNLCGIAEPRISALAMRDAAFYLGHDSGPMHLAALAGTRCVAVFSARAKPGVWFPRGNGHKIFYPWELASRVPAKAGFRTAGQSILTIEPSEVIRETISLLEREAD